MSTHIRTTIAILILAAAAPVAAQDAKLGGFGTASVSCFDNDKADYVINEQPKGPGRTRRCDTGLDSVLGAQLDADLARSVDLGLQVVVDRNYDGTYTPEVTVAQLRWQLGDATSLRIGRMPTVAFLHEEDRKVRFAQPWVRPPLEVYGLVPAFSNDGIAVLHVQTLGQWVGEWHGGISSVEYHTPQSNSSGSAVAESRHFYLDFALRDANTVAKVGYGLSRVSLRDDGLDSFMRQLRSMPGGAALAESLEVDGSRAQLLSLGLRHESDDWLFMGEFGYRTVEGHILDQFGAYVTVGKHLGPWMPYATLARRKSRGPTTDARAQALGPMVQFAVESLMNATRYDNTSVSLGLSRTITDKATFKVQADWIRPDKNSWGLYTNHAYPYNSGSYRNPGSDWLLTTGIDFVF